MQTDNYSGVTYQDGLPPAHFDDAVELYESAFGAKFSRAIADPQKRIRLIRNGIQPEYAISAFADERLVDIAGFHTPAGSLTGGITVGAILKSVGLMRGIRACCIFSLYDRKPAAGELVMDGIAVRSSHRGCGIGTELLKRIVTYAGVQGYKTVRLDVIDSNPSARKLYERFGFKAVRQERFPYLSGILGFSGSTTMEYETGLEDGNLRS